MGKLGNWIKGSGSYEVKEIAGISEKGELVTNGDFSAWTGDDPDGWSVSEDANNYITEDSDGGARFIRVSSSVYMYQACVTENSHFKCIVNISKDNGGIIAISDGSGEVYGLISSVGVHVFYFKSVSPLDRLYITGSDGTDITIKSISVQEVPEGYPLLDAGTKYLECTSDGTIALPSTQAYGTWEFDLFKGDDANNTDVYFVSGSKDTLHVDSYQVGFSTSEQVRGGYNASQAFASSTGYIENNTWYRLKITRTKDGEFYVYIKGGSFGFDDWTLVDDSIDGANPFTNNTTTESKYIMLDLDDGDKIANIKVLNDVKQ